MEIVALPDKSLNLAKSKNAFNIDLHSAAFPLHRNGNLE